MKEFLEQKLQELKTEFTELNTRAVMINGAIQAYEFLLNEWNTEWQKTQPKSSDSEQSQT